MKWITRERARVDRIACPWLISRFIDPKPEFLFVPEYWPDFDRQRFFSAIEQYATRDRRFGALTEQVAVAGA